jgi:integrating conjugative element protein (TIGR03755 family)
MEAVIRQGGDPYEDWIKMAKGENWKTEVNTNKDGVVAKANVEKNAGRDGVTWIGGVKKGGFAQGPIEVVRDIVQAGYLVTMNQSPASSPTTVFPSTGAGATKLTQAFASPATAADWAVAVIGDKLIATCDEVGCPAKGGSPGTGLLPKFEAEKPIAQTQLLKAVNTTVPERADLDAASAPGVMMTRELVDALRDMRPLERDVALGRLSMEVAQARTIDRALLIRNTFLTGSGVPEATYDAAQKEVRAKVDEINRYIDDLLFETRVRREVVSNTAGALIEAYRVKKLESVATEPEGRLDKRQLIDGRVK